MISLPLKKLLFVVLSIGVLLLSNCGPAKNRSGKKESEIGTLEFAEGNGRTGYDYVCISRDCSLTHHLRTVDQAGNVSWTYLAEKIAPSRLTKLWEKVHSLGLQDVEPYHSSKDLDGTQWIVSIRSASSTDKVFLCDNRFPEKLRKLKEFLDQEYLQDLQGYQPLNDKRLGESQKRVQIITDEVYSLR